MVPKDVKATDDELIFTFDKIRVTFKHLQLCCEDVHIEDIVGDINDLIGNPLVVAEVVEGEIVNLEYGDYQWTYYKFDTIKGGINVRFYGTSNGYYSVGVDMVVDQLS